MDSEGDNLKDGLLEAETESGICKVLCYSPNHSMTIPQMKVEEIVLIIK